MSEIVCSVFLKLLQVLTKLRAYIVRWMNDRRRSELELLGCRQAQQDTALGAMSINHKVMRTYIRTSRHQTATQCSSYASSDLNATPYETPHKDSKMGSGMLDPLTTTLHWLRIRPYH